MIKRYYPALDPGGASGTPAVFGASTGNSSSALFSQETMNITGAAGADITVQVTTYTNTNPSGRVLKDGSEQFLNSTFIITLDGSGNGSFVARVEGAAGYIGTIVRAIFSIVGVSVGQIGAPNIKQISKTF